MIVYKTRDEIELINESSLLVSKTLGDINKIIEPGITPLELDKFAENLDKYKIIDWHNKLKNVEYQIKTSDNPRLWLEINLTSLLEKSQNNNTFQENEKKPNEDESYQKQIKSENIKNKKTLDKLQIKDENNAQSKSDNMNNLEVINNNSK